MTQLDYGNRNCSCGADCEETDYDVYLSQAKWPSKMYEVISHFNLMFTVCIIAKYLL